MDLLKRIRGALGIGALGALGFHLIGWVVIGVESLAAGTWPSLMLIARMTAFTLPVGGFVGLLTAGAITLVARSSGLVTKGRAFLLGLPLGAAGGLLLSLSAGGLSLTALAVNTITFGMVTGGLGAGAVAVAAMGEQGELEAPAQRPRSLGGPDGAGVPAALGTRPRAE